jgi:hypothetical protein
MVGHALRAWIVRLAHERPLVLLNGLYVVLDLVAVRMRLSCRLVPRKAMIQRQAAALALAVVPITAGKEPARRSPGRRVPFRS